MLHYVLPPSLTTPLADIQGGLIDPKTTFATQMITALTPTMTADIQGGLITALTPTMTADIQGGLITALTPTMTADIQGGLITALTPTMTADIQGGLIDPKTRSSVQYAINLLLIDAVPLFGAIAKAARRIKVRERPRA